MAYNTGYKQATVAYKVSIPNGFPVDINGTLCSLSGARQAIRLLEGYPNPDPKQFEVEGYFSKKSYVNGNPTFTLDIDSCPVGLLSVSPEYVVLDPLRPSAKVTLFSSGTWALVSGATAIASLGYQSGNAGTLALYLTRTTTVGQGTFLFRNATGQEATLYVVNVVDKPWVLDTGVWNSLGFWYDDGIWKFLNT